MDLADDLGLGQREEVVVAAQVLRVVGEALATEGGLVEAPVLEHRAHRPVEDDDPLAEQVRQAGETRGPAERRGGGRGRHDATPLVAVAAEATARGWRSRIRRTSPAHCS